MHNIFISAVGSNSSEGYQTHFKDPLRCFRQLTRFDAIDLYDHRSLKEFQLLPSTANGLRGASEEGNESGVRSKLA